MDTSAILGSYLDSSANKATIDVTKNKNTDFNKLLTDALEKDLSDETIKIRGTVGGEDYEGIKVSSGSSLLELLSQTGSSSSANSSDLGMMMLMSMMGGGGSSFGGSDSSGGLGMDMGPMFIALASLIQHMSKDDSNKTTEDIDLSDKPIVEEEKEQHEILLDDEDSEEVAAEITEDTVTAPPVEVTPGGNAIIPSEAWRPVTPGVSSTASDRSPERLRSVIDQFSVETAERYRPYRRGNDTYCNIFLWDVTRAMGCEIPHFVNPGTGTPREFPDVQGAVELDANATQDWLVNHGSSYGWREVSAAEAQAYANEGKPAVTSWKNKGGIGHVQVVCPSNNGEYDSIRGVTVAQAGSSRYNYANISSTFGASKLSQVRYFVHE